MLRPFALALLVALLLPAVAASGGLRAEPYEARGATAAAACLMTLSTCLVPIQATPLDGTHALPAGAAALDATLAWSRAPGAPNLAIGLVWRDHAGWASAPGAPYRTGPPPLHLAWDLSAYAHLDLGLHVAGYSGARVGSVGASFSAPQSYEIVGEALIAS